MKNISQSFFGKIGTVIAGQHIEASLYNRVGAGVPYLTGPDDFGETNPTVTKWTESPKIFAHSSDVLLTVKGAGVGKTNFGVDAAIGRQLMALRPDPEKLDKVFLFYFLRSCEAILSRLGQGATVPGISKPDVEKIHIPVFSLHEQKRIANILEKADAVRLKRRKALRLTSEFPIAFFRESFEVSQYSQNSEEPLARIAEVVSGVAKGRKFNGQSVIDVPYLRVANVQAGFLDLREIKTIPATKSEVAELSLQQGDIVMTEGGDHDKLGRGALWDRDIPNCIHQNHIFRVRTDRSRILPSYFVHYLQTQSAKSYFLKCAKKTSNLASINMRQLRALPVPVPCLKLQLRYEQELKIIHKLMENQRAMEKESSTLFDSLVQRAFRGDL